MQSVWRVAAQRPEHSQQDRINGWRTDGYMVVAWLQTQIPGSVSTLWFLGPSLPGTYCIMNAVLTLSLLGFGGLTTVWPAYLSIPQ